MFTVSYSHSKFEFLNMSHEYTIIAKCIQYRVLFTFLTGIHSSTHYVSMSILVFPHLVKRRLAMIYYVRD